MATPLQSPYAQFFDSNGDPLSGGKVYFYSAGTTTPKDTYTDAGGLTPAANPVILDSSGRAAIWITGTYRIDVYTSTDVLVRSIDNVPAFTSGGDMTKAVYDPANIAQQVVGTTAVQTLTNKTLTDPTINAAGGTLVLPQSSSPTPTAEGSAAWDTDDNRIVVGDGSSQKTFYPVETNSWTANATGALTSTTACSYIKMGNQVLLTVATTRVAGASSASPITLSGLPSAITPATTVGIGPIPVTSGGSDQTSPGFARATTSNTIVIYLNYGLANFASSASTTGFYNTSFIYNIA